MLHIELHDDATGERLHIGTLEDFVNALTAEIGSVTTVVTKAGFQQKSTSALDRLIQRRRDENALLSHA